MKQIKKDITNLFRPELSPENKMDPELKSIISCFHKVDLLSLNPKFHLFGDHIASKGKISILFTLFVMCFNITMLYLKFVSEKIYEGRIVFKLHFYFSIIFSSFYVAYLGVLCIFRRKIFVSFLLSLNKVFKLLGLVKKIQLYVWPYTLAFVLHHIVYSAYIYIVMPIRGTESGYILDFLYLPNLMNFILATCIMKLLAVLAERCDETMAEYGRQERVEDGLVERQFQCFVSLLEAYRTYGTLMQEMILLHVIDITVNNLLGIGIMISLSRILEFNEFILYSAIYSMDKLIRDFSLLFVMTYYCERFYIAIESVQHTCTTNVGKLDRETCDKLRKICKNVNRLCRHEFQKIRLCGLFPLDTSILVGVVSIMSTYAVVVLQLAFVIVKTDFN